MSVPSMQLLAAVGRSATTWTPSSLPGAVHWWDASEADDFTLSGSEVSHWNDRIGSLHLTQATSSARPLRDATQNGLSIVRFNGDDWLDNTAALIDGDILAAYVVGELGASPSYARFISLASSTGGTDYLSSTAADVLSRHEELDALAGFRESNRRGYQSVTLSTWWSALSYFDGNNHSIYVNGAVGTSAASTGSFIGRHLRVGNDTTGVVGLIGRIAEIVLCTSAQSSTDRANFLAYSRSKWATP